MANLITRGFGALQRIITRGFFSGAAPSPDCYVGFEGKITEPDTSPVGYIGEITDLTGFIGTITEPLPLESVGFMGVIGIDNGFSGKITGNAVFEGLICDVC